MVPQARPNAVFVLGVTARSGTNFVQDAIATHPVCGQARDRTLGEDYLINEAGPVFAFTDALAKRWVRWDAQDASGVLLSRLSDAMVEFLAEGAGGIPVTATPGVTGIERFFDLFQSAALVVIVRDPRSVVASATASWSADGETWAWRWARNAKKIRKFDQQSRDRGLNYRIVRYEDLVTRNDAVRELLAGIGLDPDEYDYQAFRDLPTRGSSERAADGGMNWKPVQDKSDFSPLRRWADWDPAYLERIEWLATPYMEEFGYERVTTSPANEAARHRARDAALYARIAMEQGRQRTQVIRKLNTKKARGS